VARKHAQILTSIWMDDRFAALADRQQRTYLFLLSQPDLSLAGVLVTRTRVWSRRCANGTVARFEDELDALHAAGMIVWDQDTDEVWIRSFHKHNVGLSPKTLIGASRALAAVISPVIRQGALSMVHPELRDDFAAGLDQLGYKVVQERIETLTPWDTPSYTPCDTPSHTPSGGGYHTDTDTGDLIPETGDLRPEVSSPTGSPGTALVLVSDAQPPAAPSKYPADFETWWQTYPRKTGKGAAAKAYRKARRTLSAGSLLAALDAHLAAWQANGKPTEFIPHPATWLNEARYDDPPETVAPPTRRNNRVDDNLAAIQAGLARAKELGL
jgi:hypothetical protein